MSLNKVVLFSILGCLVGLVVVHSHFLSRPEDLWIRAWYDSIFGSGFSKAAGSFYIENVTPPASLWVKFLVGAFVGGIVTDVVTIPLYAAKVKKDLALRPRGQAEANYPTKKCPDCAENVKSEAKVCRYCGHQFHA